MTVKVTGVVVLNAVRKLVLGLSHVVQSVAVVLVVIPVHVRVFVVVWNIGDLNLEYGAFDGTVKVHERRGVAVTEGLMAPVKRRYFLFVKGYHSRPDDGR